MTDAEKQLGTLEGKININTASKEQLMILPDLGVKKVNAILRYRKRRGKFESVDGLQKIKSIGEATFEKIRPYMTVKGDTDIHISEIDIRDLQKEPVPDTMIIGQVNVNTATLEELDLLPGLGEQKAKEIIAYREKNGPFKRKKNLLHVQGIGEAIFDAIDDYVKLSGKTNAHLIAVKEMPPERINELEKELHTKMDAIRKREKEVENKELVIKRAESITILNAFIGELRSKTEEIADYVKDAGIEHKKVEIAAVDSALLAEYSAHIKSLEEQLALRDQDLVTAQARIAELEAMLGKDRRDLEMQRRTLDEEFDTKARDLQIMKEELLRKEVEIIIDEAKFEEISRKERELAAREENLREREKDMEGAYAGVEQIRAEKEEYANRLRSRESELMDYEKRLKAREIELQEREEKLKEELMQREVELIAREVEIEELRKRGVTPTVDDSQIKDLRKQIQQLKEERIALLKQEEELNARELEMQKRSSEFSSKETQLEVYMKRESELEMRERELQAKEDKFLMEAHALFLEAKRIKEKMLQKKIDLMAKEEFLKEILEEERASS